MNIANMEPMKQGIQEPENMELEINDPENMGLKIVEPEAMEPENLAQDDREPQNMEEELIEEEKDSTLKFIEAVKEHKCIWDMQSEDYYNKPMYRAAWKSLVPPSKVPMPDQPLGVDQKADLKLKVSELQKVWKGLRDSYYKNEDPGRKYKDSLRFLHTAFQSREMEDLLEFDEPSWDLMDIRTWRAKKAHTPRNARITDPAPEYVKARLIKKPRLSYFDNLALERAKQNGIPKEKSIAEEYVNSCNDHWTDSDNSTDSENATEQHIDTGVAKMVDIENATDNQIKTDAEKVTSSVEQMAGLGNETENQIETDLEKVTSSVENMDGIENSTDKQIETAVESNHRETDIEKVDDIENVSVEQILNEIEKIIGKEDGPGIVTDIENATVSKNETETENATVTQKTTEEKKPGCEPMSILEKAMRLYELEYPGEWSSDEDEATRASRTYVEVTTQTHETEEFPKMPVPIQMNKQEE